MDPSSILSVFQSIQVATEIAKLLKSADTSLEGAEQKMKVAELISSLADIKIDLAIVQEEILAKDKEILSLKEKMRLKDNMIWESPYYMMTDECQVKSGPFCPGCYENDEKVIHLQNITTGSWQCHICSKLFKDSSYQKPKLNRIPRSSYSSHG